jgi:hypothetical protein
VPPGVCTDTFTALDSQYGGAEIVNWDPDAVNDTLMLATFTSVVSASSGSPATVITVPPVRLAKGGKMENTGAAYEW